jgi:iron complex transport system ATP-binding protein
MGVLAVLHDLNMAARYADRVAIMQGGRMTALGAIDRTLDPATLSKVFATPIVRIEADGLMALVSPGQGP